MMTRFAFSATHEFFFPFSLRFVCCKRPPSDSGGRTENDTSLSPTSIRATGGISLSLTHTHFNSCDKLSPLFLVLFPLRFVRYTSCIWSISHIRPMRQTTYLYFSLSLMTSLYFVRTHFDGCFSPLKDSRFRPFPVLDLLKPFPFQETLNGGKLHRKRHQRRRIDVVRQLFRGGRGWWTRKGRRG